MRKEWLTGEGTFFEPLGSERREATFTCAHCSTVVRVPDRADADKLGGWCMVCDKAICPACVKTGKCDPMEEKIKRLEARIEARRSYGF